MDTKVAEFIHKKLPAKDARQAIEFLERNFSKNGQIVIASVFVFACEQDKPMEKVFDLLNKEWGRIWDHQHPDLRGNPDAPGGAGLQNRASLENIYAGLGLRSPLQRANP